MVAAGAMGSPAFADDAAPTGPSQAASQANNQRAISIPGDRRAMTRQRVRLRPAALLHPRVETAVATFPGFRALPDGRTQVFVELSRSVAVKEKRDGATLTYILRGARIVVRNNTNPLITTHFSTPVDRARLVRAGEDLDFVVDLRADAGPTYEIVATEEGAARLEVTFPAGDYPQGGARRFEPPASRDRGAPSAREPAGDRASSSKTDSEPVDDSTSSKEAPHDEGAAAPPAPHP
jgi:hypothetical protein